MILILLFSPLNFRYYLSSGQYHSVVLRFSFTTWPTSIHSLILWNVESRKIKRHQHFYTRKRFLKTLIEKMPQIRHWGSLFWCNFQIDFADIAKLFATSRLLSNKQTQNDQNHPFFLCALTFRLVLFSLVLQSFHPEMESSIKFLYFFRSRSSVYDVAVKSTTTSETRRFLFYL